MTRAEQALAATPGAARSWRLTPPEKLHLTLAFLGEVEEGLARNLADRIRDASSEPLKAPGLTISAPGTCEVLGGGGALAVLTRGIDDGLERFYRAVRRDSVVEEILRARHSSFGAGPESSPEVSGGAQDSALDQAGSSIFKPHLTFARRVRGQGRSGSFPCNLGLDRDLDWTPSALTVTFSTLRPSGSFYETAGTLPLRPRSQP